jgi:hypothetical protein
MCVVRLEEVRATLTRRAPAARRPRILEVRRATEARTETKRTWIFNRTELFLRIILSDECIDLLYGYRRSK